MCLGEEDGNVRIRGKLSWDDMDVKESQWKCAIHRYCERIRIQQAECKPSISLTEKGMEEATRIYERHTILTEFFMKAAGVSRKIAEEDACRAEHIISNETFLGIKKFLEQ